MNFFGSPMMRKVRSNEMMNILDRLEKFGEFEIIKFEDKVSEHISPCVSMQLYVNYPQTSTCR